MRASITNLSSGTKEITLRSLAKRSSLNTITELPAPAGINDETTIIESNIFQPSLKKFFLCSSEKNLIRISITKNIVINMSLIKRTLKKVSLTS